MEIESTKEHIKHVLKIKNRNQRIAAMKDFWEWLAAMPESQRRKYLQDLLKAEHFLPEDSQKMEIKSLREEAMMELSEKQKSALEKTLESLHEEKHIEEKEPAE